MKHKMYLFAAVMIFISTASIYSQLSLEVVWEKPQGGVIDAKFSPDGKFVYCAVGKTIKKLDVETGEFIATFDNSLSPFIYAVISMNISDDGKYIATQNGAGAINIWDTEQQKLIKVLQLGTTMASFTKDNVLLIASAKDESKGIILYDYLNDRYLDTISYSPIIKLIYTSKDGKYFITGSIYRDSQENGYCKVTLWDTETLKPIRDYEVPEGNDNGFRKIQLSDNNKLIGVNVFSPNIFVNIIETETCKVVATNKFGTAGGNFVLLQDDYFIIYEVASFEDYGLSIYKYPNLYQSKIDKGGGDVLVSFENHNEIDDKLYVFQAHPTEITLYKKSTTSVNETIKPGFKINVESEKIIISYDHAENIKIVDLKGRILLDIEVSGSSASIPNTFTPGTYICVIKSGDNEYSQKFQVVR